MARFEVTSVKSLTELSNSEYNLMRSLGLKTQSDFGRVKTYISHILLVVHLTLFFMENDNANEII